MRPLTTLAASLLALVTAGCATVCRPVTIEVDRKDERSRLVSEFRGIRTSEVSGRVIEVREDRIVHEYWLRDKEGRWHQVSESVWRAVTVGGRTEVCP